jgi:hypothetical protein
MRAARSLAEVREAAAVAAASVSVLKSPATNAARPILCPSSLRAEDPCSVAIASARGVPSGLKFYPVQTRLRTNWRPLPYIKLNGPKGQARQPSKTLRLSMTWNKREINSSGSALSFELCVSLRCTLRSVRDWTNFEMNLMNAL